MFEITAGAAPGEGVRRVGEDAAAGAVIREAGEAVRAIDVAAAEAAGIQRCAVREPRTRLIVAGPKPGPVPDLLQRHAVLAGAQAGYQPVSGRTRASAVVSDPPADLLLICGDRALAHEILARHGTVLAQALALRPGEGAACGRIGAAPVIIVPPRLDAALAVALLILRPCLDHLSGAAPRPAARGRLSRKIASGLGLTELVLLRETEAGFEPLASGDLPLPAMGRADHWLAVPPQSEGFAAGELVEAHRL